MIVEITDDIKKHARVHIKSFSGTFHIRYDKTCNYVRFCGSAILFGRGVDQGIPPNEFRRLLKSGILKIKG
jgi:hypothetical protein